MDTADVIIPETLDHMARAISECRSQETLCSTLDVFTRWAGFRWYAVHDANVNWPSVKRSLEWIWLTNYPSELWEDYDRSGFARHDPIIRALECSASAVPWTEIPTIIPLSRAQEDVLSSAFCAGIRAGVSVAVRVPGRRQGIVTLISDHPIEIASCHKATLGFIAPIAFDAANRTGDTHSPHGTTSNLQMSPRQLECLVLVARGKSDWEAGQILGISEQTVHRHVEIVRMKLGVRRRTQLVAKALHLGLIGYGDVL
ncbi:helix-turn-helix transcriptional regulator [Paracoccus alkenifer]|uniref:DNA-binding transcriptional regulator, CsgD family n=1 Tax=Paracoccus alkenifer TaxID=65735 RepID=A0A1H6NAD5_9RHOB|nr:DNA-binding transcriptional regulator, CsgD family [Paracoccus alkenifer]